MPPANKPVVMADSYTELRPAYPNRDAFARHIRELSNTPGSQFASPMPPSVVVKLGTVEYMADVYPPRGDVMWHRLSGYPQKLTKMSEKYGVRNPRPNPIYKLTVMAPDESRARAKGRRFGRVVDVVRKAKGKYHVTVDQAAWGNPKNPGIFPVMPWLQEQYEKYTDKELREMISERREDIAVAKRRIKKTQAEIKKYGQMTGFGPRQDEIEESRQDIQDAQDDIARWKGVIEKRKEERRKKREAKKPPKAVVMRRRGGVTTRANPKKNPKKGKNVRALVREALK